MATITIYGTSATVCKTTPTTGGPANWQAGGFNSVPVRAMVDTYTGAGDASGSVLAMFTDGIYNVLPAGLNVIGFILSIDVAVSSFTISVGDMSSATRYASASSVLQTAGAYLISGTNTTTAAYYIIGTNAATTGPGTSSPATVSNGDNQIILTTGGASLTSSRIIGLTMLYTLA